ncbi:hypothetical protein NFI96_006141, partial [Prochilodus magdalenae]
VTAPGGLRRGLVVCMMHDLNSMMHQCPVCLKQFEFVSKLRRHQLTHSGQKPFSCSICEKAFRQSAHLKRHLESHAKLRTVLVSGDSQLSCTYVPHDVPHVGPEMGEFEQTGIHEDPELMDQSVWYNAPQTHSESGWRDVKEDCMQEDKLVEAVHTLSVIPTSLEQKHSEDKLAEKQTDTVQWNCGDMAEKENDCHRNGQYSFIQPELSPAKLDQSSGAHRGSDAAVSDSSHRQATLETLERTPRKHQCATCLKCFSAPSKLRRHVLIHTSQRPFACQLCTKAFRQLAHLKIHLTTHFSQRRRKAKHKPQSVPSGSVTRGQGASLDRPIQTFACPSEEQEDKAEEDLSGAGSSKGNCADVELLPEDVDKVKPDCENLGRNKVMHECPVCFKCFSAPSKLRRHCLIHTGQRPFQCSVCCRSFRQLAHLKAHCSIHAGPRKKASSLQLHRFVNQPQPSKARLRCLAGSSFGRKVKSAVQTEKHNTGTTPSRSISFSTSVKLTTDKTLPIRGQSCVRAILNKAIVNAQGNWCTVCSKGFSAPSKLTRHLLIHTGQRPFKCLVCHRAFTQKSHLKVHRCRGERPGALGTTASRKLGRRGLCAPGPSMNISQGSANGQPPFTAADNTGSLIPSDSLTSLKWNSGELPHGAGENFTAPGEESPHLVPTLSAPDEELRPPASSFTGILAALKETRESGHQCTICLKMFDFPSKLSRHLLIHMDLKPFTCAVCTKSFRQLCHLRSHEKVHTAKRKMMNKGNQRRRIVASKAAGASKTSRVLIESCSQDSGNLPLPQKPDPDCERGDSPPSHLSEPSAEEPPCTTTTENTNLYINVNKRSLNAGPTQNTSQRRREVNQCSFCLKTFDFPSKLSRHLRIHTGIRPFECHVCHKSFKQLSHLQCHQWVHNRKVKSLVKKTLELVQTSEDCPLEQLGHEAYSADEQHPDWNPGEFGPDQEEGKIKSEADLDRSSNLVLKHEASTSVIGADGVVRNVDWDGLDRAEQGDPSRFEAGAEEKLPLDVPKDCSSRSPTGSDCCRLGFSHDLPAFRGPKEEMAEGGCDKHLTEPPNDLPICPACSQCFPTLKKLQTHKCPAQVPDDRLRKSYQCAVCFKSFEAPSKLKRHYVIHTGQRPYQCTICSKAFTQSSHLKTHLLSHR